MPSFEICIEKIKLNSYSKTKKHSRRKIMKNENKTNKIKTLIPYLALKLAKKSTKDACVWWFNQPKISEELKKQISETK